MEPLTVIALVGVGAAPAIIREIRLTWRMVRKTRCHEYKSDDGTS